MNKKAFFILLLVFSCLVGYFFPLAQDSEIPAVCVSGIMYDNELSSAVINGELLRQGEELRGIKVLSISERVVSLEYDGHIFEKEIGDGCVVKERVSVQADGLKITRDTKRYTAPRRTQNKQFNAVEMIILQYAPYAVVFVWLLLIVLYIYNSLCLHKIANKTNTPYGWLAWLPIANLFLMLMIAKKSFWWFLLLLIPLVNFICFLIIWMDVAKSRNKPAWLGLLMAIPLANFIIMGYLAFSK